MAKKENVQIKKASEELDKMNLTESERELYEARQMGLYLQRVGLANAKEQGYQEGEKAGKEAGIREGKEAGIKEGANRNKKEIFKKLLIKNTSDNDIMDLLEISKKELEKMKKEVKKEQTI